MKYLSVCSGIEAATVAWHHLGWTPVAFSEIEKFPSQVLAHHYPDVTNYGDMTKFKEWDIGAIDILVGGTPCQSFSVAGLRAGLDDPRGNLMLTFGAIANHLKPEYIVWENVPGVLSTNKGQDFKCFLDMLEELGYICDIDILDAQFHGIPQRRRRVFVCGQHVTFILKKKTVSSALTIAQCLLEILHCILIDALNPLGLEPANLKLPRHSKDGAMRRIKLFGLLGESKNWQTCLENLIEISQRFPQEPSFLNANLGESGQGFIQADLFQDLKTETPFIYTDKLLKSTLEEILPVMKLFTTSTAINLITNSQIYSCLQAVLHIGKLIVRLNQSSPCWSQAALSCLTVIQECMKYARQTNNQVFRGLFGFYKGFDFIGEAERTVYALECLGDWRSAAEVLFEPESLCRDTKTSRKEGKDIAKCLTTGIGTRFDGETDTFVTQVYETHPNDSRIKEMGNTCQTVTSRWGTGGGNVSIALAENTIGRQPQNGGNGNGFTEGGPMYTLNATGVHGVAQPINTMTMSVRRLTPVECERLQGFPDTYTDIQPNSKPTADGPRYKALGNSMAVPVMRWIGERIKMVNSIKVEQ